MQLSLTRGNGFPPAPQALRRDLQRGETDDLWRRRAIINVSPLGMASMTAVSLRQTGIIGHLPDPPFGDFDSDRVNSSDTAYKFGVPDGTVSLASLAANIPLAAFGDARRAREQPWVPIIAAGKAAIEAAVAGWYFYQMPAKEKAWCGYCITGALANFAIFALTLPEAGKAINVLRGK
ncbi:MAG TPA: vitamin K epoxide reductase family protein [Blastocatellia bacterium]|nr:vitamin K epoxide reductase family protein [Blastocatellia bacterium]